MADLRVLRAVENGIDIVPRPFDEAGRRIGMTGPEVRGNLKEMLSNGIDLLLRRDRGPPITRPGGERHGGLGRDR